MVLVPFSTFDVCHQEADADFGCQLGSIVFFEAKKGYLRYPDSPVVLKVLQDLDLDRSKAGEVGIPPRRYASQKIVVVRDVIGGRSQVIDAGTVSDIVDIN